MYAAHTYLSLRSNININEVCFIIDTESHINLTDERVVQEFELVTEPCIKALLSFNNSSTVGGSMASVNILLPSFKYLSINLFSVTNLSLEMYVSNLDNCLQH